MSKLRTLSTPELLAIVLTRVALGIGIGFLQGRRLSDRARKRAGLVLVSLGALSSIPLAFRLRRAGLEPLPA